MKYRFIGAIVDTTTGKEVVSGASYMSEADKDGSIEAVELEVSKVLNHFFKKLPLLKEEENQEYIDNNVEVLRKLHSEVAKTDDPDEFEDWLDKHEKVELVAMIDNVKSYEDRK